MVFWYFGTAFLRESHRAGGEDLRSTDMILHPVALQGKAVSASTCTRPFTYAKRPSRQRLPFKRRLGKVDRPDSKPIGNGRNATSRPLSEKNEPATHGIHFHHQQRDSQFPGCVNLPRLPELVRWLKSGRYEPETDHCALLHSFEAWRRRYG